MEWLRLLTLLIATVMVFYGIYLEWRGEYDRAACQFAFAAFAVAAL